jgi:hypothetical protein
MEAAEVTELQKQVAELAQKVESISEEHAEFRSVHISRRGPEGGRGIQGEPGVGIKGDQGEPGKDADISVAVAEAVKAAKKAIEDEYGFYLNQGVLKELIDHSLKVSGVIDENGKAIIIPGDRGPQGEQGIQGERGEQGIQGERGERGPHGVQGQPGRDGSDSLTPGPQGEPGLPGKDGKDGKEGPEGLRGYPGEGLSRQEVVDLVLDMSRRKSI